MTLGWDYGLKLRKQKEKKAKCATLHAARTDICLTCTKVYVTFSWKVQSLDDSSFANCVPIVCFNNNSRRLFPLSPITKVNYWRPLHWKACLCTLYLDTQYPSSLDNLSMYIFLFFLLSF
jgi:hypothetical protein